MKKQQNEITEKAINSTDEMHANAAITICGTLPLLLLLFSILWRAVHEA